MSAKLVKCTFNFVSIKHASVIKNAHVLQREFETDATETETEGTKQAVGNKFITLMLSWLSLEYKYQSDLSRPLTV